PISMPPTIAATVSRIVLRTPLSTASEVMYLPCSSHSSASLVNRKLTNIATSTSTTAAATQRPGCRTGTARIASGRAFSTSSSTVMRSALTGGVDRRFGDGAALDAGVGQDLLVGAVGDEGLEGAEDGVLELARVLADR